MSAPDRTFADEPDDRFEVLDTEDLHRDAWIVALRSDRIRKRGSGEEPYRRLTLEHPGAVVILALDDERRALCLRQYRHPVRHRLVELPAGLRDAGDEPEEAVAAFCLFHLTVLFFFFFFFYRIKVGSFSFFFLFFSNKNNF